MIEVKMEDATDEPISVILAEHDGQQFVNIHFGVDEDNGMVELTRGQVEDFIDSIRFISKRMK